MTDIAVIILTGKEELHIKRCLEKLAPLEPKQVFVVESQKGDRTHDVAIETAKEVASGQWLVVSNEDGVSQELTTNNSQLTTLHLDRRAMAEKKVAEWLEGVDAATFEAALRNLVEEKTAAGEYRFSRAEDRELAMQGARRFFADFARNIVSLSDGRCVYFAPDPMASERNACNAMSWAEYAFHAVSAGGAKVPGTNYNERWFNPHKVRALGYLEEALRAERYFVRLSKVDCRYDSVMFAGESHDGESVQVVTRLDEMGNMDANLSEVTFNAARRRQKKLPRLVPLTEAVRTVVHHQNTAGSYPQDENSVANPPSPRKGGGGEREVDSGQKLGVSGQPTTLHLVWHAWPGMYGPQFNWALDNLPITSKWVLRLDADEYLEPAAIPELIGHLAADEPGVDAYALPLVRVWLGYRLKHGVETKILTRVFRHGVGRCEDRAMDEHISVPGATVVLENGFVDDNLNGFEWWREKHIGYAKREALDGVNRFVRIPWGATVDMKGKPLSAMDRSKVKYYHLPRYLRAIVYWGMRYFLGKGFLDGVGGWRWNWWQGLWYRWQVDREIGRLKRNMRGGI